MKRIVSDGALENSSNWALGNSLNGALGNCLNGALGNSQKNRNSDMKFKNPIESYLKLEIGSERG